MPKNNELVVEEIPEDDDDDFNDTDYGFIIDSNGDLKTMMLPEELMDNPPSSIKKILKIFGIKDIHQFEPRTLH
jgi:hypothetical protein